MIAITHRGGTFTEETPQAAHDLAQRLVGGVVEVLRTDDTSVTVRGPKGSAVVRAI